MNGKIRELAISGSACYKKIEKIEKDLRVEIGNLPRTVKQNKIARDLGVVDSTVSMIISGKRGFGIDLLKRMEKWKA